MSYLLQEPTTFINIKLTDKGRQLLSLGQLTFDSAVMSDREVDYNLGRLLNYDLSNNRVLAPKDDQPSITENLNGTSPIPLVGQQIGSATQAITAQTTNDGFFTGSSNSWTIKTVGLGAGEGAPLGVGTIDYSLTMPSGGTSIHVSPGGYSASTGDLVYIPWEPIQYSAATNSGQTIPYTAPTNALWYRINTISGHELTLDRSVPNFGSAAISGSLQGVKTYYYPFNGIQSYYGSATTVNTRVWNMNITRTSSVLGTTSAMSGYSTYGSIEYAGTKLYLGYSSDTRMIGIIHYTNQFTGNTYSEQLVPGVTQIHIPNVMWHLTAGRTNGTTVQQGLTLYDAYGNTMNDGLAQSTFKYLRDGTSSTSNIVGRVYHKLKLFVIDDPELLTALSYKSNRSYTLPEPVTGLKTDYGSGLDDGVDVTGLCKSNYTYYVSYVVSNDATISNTNKYGYQQPLHCAYIGIQQGPASVLGQASARQYLTVDFNNKPFPYMRSTANMSALSGTGWNANKVQILVKEFTTASTTSGAIGSLTTNDWKLVSSGARGGGIFTGDTIDPATLANQTFVISQEDYDSGTTYSLAGAYSAFSNSIDYQFSDGLNFGNESFIFANITTGIRATTYKTVMTMIAASTDLNSSVNKSFDSDYNSSTYLTEFGILNKRGDLVAVGKPSYPIEKNSSRHLIFQLEIDF